MAPRSRGYTVRVVPARIVAFALIGILAPATSPGAGQSSALYQPQQPQRPQTPEPAQPAATPVPDSTPQPVATVPPLPGASPSPSALP